MGNFKDFNLDLKKIKDNENITRGIPSVVACCLSGSVITMSIITCKNKEINYK